MLKICRTSLYLYLYSIVSALVFMIITRGHYRLNFMNCRIDMFNECMNIPRGGTWAQVLQNFSALQDHSVSYYFYLAFLGHFLQIVSATKLFIVLQLLAFFFVLFIYPIITYYIYKSIPLSIFSNIALFLLMRHGFLKYLDDSYWVMGWVVLSTMPFIYFLYRRKKVDKKFWLLFLFINFIIAVSNIPRDDAGIVCLLLVDYLAVLLLCKYKKYFSIIFILIISVLSMNIFNNIIPNLCLRAYGINRTVTSFGPWHTAYIGLGWNSGPEQQGKWYYKANPYGITFIDAAGVEFVKRHDSSIQYDTPQYFATLRNEYIRILLNNPQFVMHTYALKLFVCCYNVFFSKILLFLLMGLLVLKLILRRYFQVSYKAYGVVLLVSLGEMVFPMVAMPTSVYLYGAEAGVMVLYLLMGSDIFLNLQYLRRYHKEGNREYV